MKNFHYEGQRFKNGNLNIRFSPDEIADIKVGNCPKCGKLIQESKTRYFHDEKDCGQAILWGDVNKYSKSIKTWRIE